MHAFPFPNQHDIHFLMLHVQFYWRGSNCHYNCHADATK
jgi:hypothetical protein